MKVLCSQHNLSRGLSIVGRAVPARTPLPITQNVLLQAEGEHLRLTATNLEMAISVWVPAQVEEEGSLTVPAKLMAEFVNSLPGEQVEVVSLQRPRGLTLKCARFEARVNGTPSEEFPPIPQVEGGVEVQVDPEAFRLAITQVVLAAATEESRPVLTGVKVELEGDRFTLAAADGFRLAVHRGTLLREAPEPVYCIIPARTLSEVNRLLGDQEGPVEIALAPQRGQVLFRLARVEVVSQLVQGTFPDYARLIPQSYATRAVVALEEFRGAARTASIFARDGSGIIRLHILPGPPGVLRVFSRAEEVGESLCELDARVEGGEAKIAFNSKYLHDVLAVLRQEEVALDVTSPSSPGVFRGMGDERYIHVVMPMFVNWQ